MQYGPNGLAAAQVLQARVRGGADLEAVSSLQGHNLVLVTGRSYAGTATTGTATTGTATTGTATTGTGAAGAPAAPAVGASSTTSASTAPSTAPSPPSSVPPPAVAADSSSYYRGQYVPPGLQPGQVPESCPL